MSKQNSLIVRCGKPICEYLFRMIGLLNEPSNDDPVVPESFGLNVPEVELSLFFEEGGSLG